MKPLTPRFVVAMGLLVGHCCSVAYPLEGQIILPGPGSPSVVFEMNHDQDDVIPSEVFQVFVGNQDMCCEGKSAMAGRYSIDERSVSFVPAFDFVEGQKYTVKVPGNGAGSRNAHIFDEFTIKRSIDSVSPEIVAVFPSGTDIPENTLRFYVHFSTPMKPHVSSDYIKLLDATGTPDTAAFMEFKQELWSEDRKRLTLLMDPGRIKRGVAQNLTLGPALLEGRTYSIVVEEGWPTANDTEKLPRFESNFTVSQPLRTIPDPDSWTIESLRDSSDDPLLIEFDRPFDYEQLHSKISVLDENGQTISGTVTIDEQERRWRFDRKGVWRNSLIQIAVDTRLEDVAGNNFIELLDHSVGTEISKTEQQIIMINLESSPK